CAAVAPPHTASPNPLPALSPTTPPASIISDGQSISPPFAACRHRCSIATAPLGFASPALDTGLLSLPHRPRRLPAFPLTAPPSSLPAPAFLPSPPAPLATCRPSPPVQSWPPAHQHSPAALWLSAGVVLPSVLTAR